MRLLASGAAIPGPTLARHLGISRAAVWRQIDTLRTAGLAIRAGRAGYQLPQPLVVLDAAVLRAALPAAVRRRVGGLESRWEVDSTSSVLARQVAATRDRTFLFAEWQRAGRGRRGRQWLSAPATNLQFSCLKRFGGGYATLSGLSLAAGVAVVRALEDQGVAGVALKWPNDLVYRGAKLGGILVELGGDATGPCHAIIGVGINLRIPDGLPQTLQRACTDLARIGGGAPPDRTALAVALVTRLVEALDIFASEGFPAFAEAWARHDALVGQRLTVVGARDNFTGVGAGVDARGALRVRTAAGLRRVDSGDVSVRPA